MFIQKELLVPGIIDENNFGLADGFNAIELVQMRQMTG